MCRSVRNQSEVHSIPVHSLNQSSKQLLVISTYASIKAVGGKGVAF